MFQIGLKQFLSLKKVKDTDTVPWTYIISELNGEEIAGKFYEKELQKKKKKKKKLFRVETVVKTKGNKLYVKWKCYDSSF